MKCWYLSLILWMVSPPVSAAPPEPSLVEAKEPSTTAQDLSPPLQLPPAAMETSLPPSGTFGQSLLRMFLSLGGVCVLIYLVLGKLVPQLFRMPSTTRQPKLIQLIDRLALSPRHSITLLKVGETHYLVGLAEHSTQLLARLDPNDISATESGAGPSTNPALRSWGARRTRIPTESTHE